MRFTLSAVALLPAVIVATAPAAAATLKPEPDAVAAAAVPFPYAEWSALLARYVDGKGRVDYDAIDRAAFATSVRRRRRLVAEAAPRPVSDPRRQESVLPRRLQRAGVEERPVAPAAAEERRPRQALLLLLRPSSSSAARRSTSTTSRTRSCARSSRTRASTSRSTARRAAARSCRPRRSRRPSSTQQLTAEAAKFCNEKRNVDFDAGDSKTLKLSRIFDWYKDDFGKAPAKVIAWINHYRADDASSPSTRRSSTSTMTGRSTTSGCSIADKMSAA